MTTLVADLVTPVADCAHQWMIDSPNGKQSFGRCFFCHGEMFFDNSIAEERQVNNNVIFNNQRGPSRTRNDDGYAAAEPASTRGADPHRQLYGLGWEDPTRG